MLEIQELILSILTLVTLYSIVHYEPNLKKYDDEIRFNIYRSLMCIAFTCMGLNILLNYCKEGFYHPFSYINSDMKEAIHIFAAYIIVDLIKMVASKNTRIDLYVHHFLFLSYLLFCNYIDKFGYICSITLICEMISIVSGVDALAMEDGDNKTSYYCKKIRKFVIKYVRMPIWIVCGLFTLRYIHKIETGLCIGGLAIPIIMLFLDKYWEGKCNKVIDLYEDVKI